MGRMAARVACDDCGGEATERSVSVAGVVHRARVCHHCGAGDRGFEPGSGGCLSCGSPVLGDLSWCADHVPAALLGPRDELRM